MSEQQLKDFNRIVNLQKQETAAWLQYWHKYSYFNDWHFWFIVALFLLPLIALPFFIDRRKLFQIGFYGFNIHVWSTYSDIMGVWLGRWNYPYKVIPFLPIGFSMDLSFVPVVFMLVYQWAINHRKNFYLFALLPSAFFAFIIKPLLAATHITKAGAAGGGLSGYFSLFALYIVVAFVSKWITDLFLHYYQKEEVPNENIQQRRLIFPFAFLVNWFRKKEKAG
jgi:hypothetical protein